MILFIYYSTTGAKCITDEENDIRVTVEKILKIKYGWKSKQHLKELTTDEFRNNLDEKSFYEGFKYYKLDRNFMEGFKKIDDETVKVYASLYDIDFSLPVITLVRSESGKYLVSDIEYDT